MSRELDPATRALCVGEAILAWWHYELDTSNDDRYPFVGEGQLLLREDGVVFQRVDHSSSDDFGPWKVAPRADGDGPYTVVDVERIFSWPATDYCITRIATRA